MKSLRAEVILNGFVDSWLVILVDENGATRGSLASGLTKDASARVAEKYNSTANGSK